MSEFQVSTGVSDQSSVRVISPFAISSEDGRQFIRVDFSEGVEFVLIKDGDDFYSNSDEQKRSGRALNISAGGALIETDEPVPEGAVISMDMMVAGEVSLSEVLALVKRVDQTDAKVALGVEFLSHERLNDLLSKPELEMLDNRFGYFPSRLQEILREHIKTAD